MIARYTPKDMAALWSSTRRYEIWLEVELAGCEAMERAGVVPAGTAEKIRGKKPKIDADRIDEIERTVKHDVIAFLTHVEEQVGEDARWLHRGMTSSDVLDTSLAIQLRDAIDAMIPRLERLLSALATRAREHAHTAMIGRSHGIHAEPITFGLALAGHHAELARGRSRLQVAREEIAVGKMAGAVGTYAHLTPEIEREALDKLGLRAETVATQIVSRDRHAAYFAALGVVAASIERLATNVRHWQRTEVLEAEEAFTAGQKGSSAMPHKRNPILSENLCGLARVVRMAVTPAMENVALWHERDISHSSVERMIGPDATATMAFMLDRAASLVEGLVVYDQNMRKNLERTGGLFFSEGVLLALVGKGVARQEAYVWVQRNAMRTWKENAGFLDGLLADPDVSAKLSPEEIRHCFDMGHVLRHVDAILDRALG
jgi:adenylosuccinate lyase